MKLYQTTLAALLLAAPYSTMASVNILQDGTFQNSIGSGLQLTPWADWTNAGVTRHAAPAGIIGNYVSLSWGTDLFQRFSAPAPGTYTLSFYVQNPMPYATKMIVDLQPPFGGNWNLFYGVIDISANSAFIFQSYTVNWNRSLGESSEFYFSNSYDAPIASRGFQGTVNPRGTFLNVADVKFALQEQAAVPEPAAWVMMIAGFGATGFAMRRRKARSYVTSA